jgi:DNA-binding CsgD family transcriptional regulator
METIYVIIADMSQLVRLGLTGVLKQMDYPLTIREITDVEKLKISLQKDRKRLLIVSTSFLKTCPAELIRFIVSKPKQTCLVLVNDVNTGIIPLISFDEIIEPPDIEKTIFRKLEKFIQVLAMPKNVSKSIAEISNREKEVLKLVALGMTNKEIAEMLFISSHTVITHRKNITSKLGIKTIAGLTVYAIINKLIKPEEIK